MNRLEVQELPNEYVGPHPALVVDGTPLDLFLSVTFGSQQGSTWDRFKGLVPALLALCNKREHLWATAVSLNFSPGRRAVPLLVCSDCCGLDCTVIFSDTVIEKNTVEWRRLGVLRINVTSDTIVDQGRRVITVENPTASPSFDEIDWLPNDAVFRFDRDAYAETIHALAKEPTLWPFDSPTPD